MEIKNRQEEGTGAPKGTVGKLDPRRPPGYEKISTVHHVFRHRVGKLKDWTQLHDHPAIQT